MSNRTLIGNEIAHAKTEITVSRLIRYLKLGSGPGCVAVDNCLQEIMIEIESARFKNLLATPGHERFFRQ